MKARNAKANWTPENSALLGTMSDRDVAKHVGCTTQAVYMRRRMLGIPAHQQRPPNTDVVKDAIGKKRVSEMTSTEYAKIAKKLTIRPNHRQGKKRKRT